MMFLKVVQQKLVAIVLKKVLRRKAARASSPDTIADMAFRAVWLGFAALLLACFGGGQAVLAAPVTFISGTVNVTGTSSTAVSDAEILTLGTTHFAYNFWGGSPNVVNGVSFNSITSATGAGNLSISGTATPIYFNGYYQAGAIDLLSTGYQNLLKGGVYTDGTGTITITMNGLTVGKTYVVQMWANESRNNFSGSTDRAENVIGGNTVRIEYNVSNLGGGVGQYVLGAFVATATSQSFTMTPPAGLVSPSAQINAIQVRDVTDLVGVWTGAVNGNWDLTTANWSGSSKFSVFSPMLSGITLKFGDQNGSGQAVTNTVVTVQSAGMSLAGGTVAFTAGTLDYSLLSAGGTLGINGTGSLSKTGASTLTLGGTHTFTGGVNVSGGTLLTASVKALPNAPVTVASGAKLDLGGFDQFIGALTNNGTIANSGSFATITLNNGFSGNGALDVGDSGLGLYLNSAVAVNVSAPTTGTGVLSLTINSTGALTFSGALGHTGGTTITKNGSGAYTITNLASASGPLVFAGSSTAITTYAGALGVNVPSVEQASDTAVLKATGAVSIGSAGKTFLSSGSATFNVTQAVAGTGDLILKTNSDGIIFVDGALNFTGDVINSGSGSTGTLAPLSGPVTKGTALLTGALGAGVENVIQDSPTSALVLYANNTSWLGRVEIRQGAVMVADYETVGVTSTPNPAGKGLIVVGTGAADAAFLYAARSSPTPPTGLAANGGNLTLSNTFQVGGSGRNVIGNADYSMNLNGSVTLNNANVTFMNSNPANVLGIYEWLTLSGGITGTGDVYFTNASGAGNTKFTVDTLPINNSGKVIFNNGSLFSGIAGTGTGANTISGGVGPNVTEIIQDSDSNPLTISGGSISVNPSGLTIISTGAAATTVSSPTTGGRLTINALGSGAMNFSGAFNHKILYINFSGKGALTLSGAINLIGNVGVWGQGTGALTLSGVLGTGVTQISQNSASSLVLSGNNTFTGPTTVTKGTLTLGGASGNELGPVASSGTLTLSGGSLRFGTYTAYTVGVLAGTSDLVLNNNSSAAVTLTVGNTRNLSATYSGDLTGTGSFNKSGTGTWTLTGANNISGDVWVNAGTLAIVDGGSLSGVRTLAGKVGGTLYVSNASVTMGAVGNFAVSYGAVGTAYATIEGSSVVNLGIGGGKVFIGGGDQGGSAFGTGVLTIKDNAVVNVVDPGGASPFAAVYLAGYGGDGTINLNGGTLTSARNFTNGTGTGTMNFNGGVLRAGLTSTIFIDTITASYVKNGGAFIDTNGYEITIPQAFLTSTNSPGGGLTKQGVGRLTLPTANTYTGGTTIAGGTLKVGVATALGTGSLTFINGVLEDGTSGSPLPAGMAQVWAGTAAFAGTTAVNTGTGSVTLTSDSTVDVRVSTLTVAGNVSGPGGLTKIGSGSLMLSGVNTYSGATVVNTGTLVLNGAGALPSGSALTIATGATVLVQNGAQVTSFTGGGKRCV